MARKEPSGTLCQFKPGTQFIGGTGLGALSIKRFRPRFSDVWNGWLWGANGHHLAPPQVVAKLWYGESGEFGYLKVDMAVPEESGADE